MNKKPIKQIQNFLHNHPGTEQRLGLGHGHVIIDREDWEEAKRELQDKYETDIKLADSYKFIASVDLVTSPDTSSVIKVMKDDRLNPNSFVMIAGGLIVTNPKYKIDDQPETDI